MSSKEAVSNKPPFPLDTIIEEDVPVLKTHMELDEKTNKVKFSRVYEMEKQQTLYTDPPKRRSTCREGNHDWHCTDVHTYEYYCTNCPRKIRINPVDFVVTPTAIISKLTGKPV